MNNYDQSTTEKIIVSNVNVDQSNSTYHHGLVVENYSNTAICLLDNSGSVTEIPPLDKNTSRGIAEIVIKSIKVIGNVIPRAYSQYSSIPQHKTNELKITRMKYYELERGPVYLREQGVTICMKRHESQIGLHHPGTRDMLQTVYQAAVDRMYKDNRSVCLDVNVNTTNRTIDQIYCFINGSLVTVNCTHIDTYDQCVYSYRTSESHELYKLDIDPTTTPASVCQIPGSKEPLIIGNCRDSVVKLYDSERTKHANKISITERDKYVLEKTSALEEQVKHLKDRIEQLTKEKEHIKSNLTLAEDELQKSRDNMKLTMDHEKAATALQQLKEETKLTQLKREVTAEQLALKKDVEESTGKAKIKSAELAIQSSESTALTTALKTAAVVIPTAIAVGSYLGSTSGISETKVGQIASLKTTLEPQLTGQIASLKTVNDVSVKNPFKGMTLSDFIIAPIKKFNIVPTIMPPGPLAAVATMAGPILNTLIGGSGELTSLAPKESLAKIANSPLMNGIRKAIPPLEFVHRGTSFLNKSIHSVCGKMKNFISDVVSGVFNFVFD